MKYILTLTLMLLVSTAAHANWFTKTADPVPEYKEKITALETQLSAQATTVNHWQIATGALGIGAVLLFVIGTALGAQTRQNHDGSTGRMGPTPPTPPTGLNGSKPAVVRKAAEKNVHTTLAA